MAIDKKLIHFKNWNTFISSTGVNGNYTTPSSGKEDDGTAIYGQIKGSSIVFIKDVGKIWTHGKVYDCNNTLPDLTDYVTESELEELINPISVQIASLTTDNVTEGTNKYFTNARALNALTGQTSALTANRALISNSSGKVAVSAVTSTELEYLDGVTSNIQTQLDAKASTTSVTNLSTQVSNKADKSELEDFATKEELTTGLNSKQATLVSGTNIKTIEGKSILGSGDIQITAAQVGAYTTGEIDSKITTLNNSIAGKADPSSVTAVSNRVTTLEGYFSTSEDSDATINKWIEIVDFLDGVAEGDDIETLLAAKANQSALNTTNTNLSNLTATVNNKVDKVTGKGLSTNDYTTAEKNKLAGIAAGAEVNVQSDWNATEGDALILNKPGAATQSAAGFMSAADKKKLDGVATGAEANVQSDWDATSGDAFIKNKPTIPTSSTVSGWGFTKNTGTVTGIEMNGTTLSPSDGVVDLGTVLTSAKAAAGTNINSVGTPSVSASTSNGVSTFTFNYLKGAKGDDGADGFGMYYASNSPTTSATSISKTYITTNSRTPQIGDFIITANGHLFTFTKAYSYSSTYADVSYLTTLKGADGTDGTDGTNGTNGSNGTNGTNGVDGLSMFYCSSSYTSAATAISRSYLTPSASVKVPVVGDLVLTSSGLLFNITSVLSSTVSVTYLTSLKGAKGDSGDDASVTSTTIENALGYTPNAIMWGLSSTAAATSPKVITCADWTLTSGNMIFVTFTAGISSTSRYIQLNVNSTGNKYVYDGVTGSYITAGQLNCDANGTHCFVYDGTRYLLVGANINTSGSSASGTVTSVATGTGLTGGPITTSGTISLATSGVTAGNYGPSSNASPDHDGTFAVPYFTVDTYGRITSASTKTITLPSAPTSSGGTADGNDKVKMTVSSSSSNLPLLTATTASPTSGSTYGTYYDTGVYVNHATKALGATIVNATTMNASGGFFQQSDETIKDFEGNVEINFDALKTIPKKYFTWKDDESKTLQIGTGAQSLQKIYPELVKDNEGILTVAYDKLAIIALAAVDKLYDEKKALEERVERLEKLIEKLA